MTKATLILGLLLFFKIGFGQLPDGSIAPNFTLQDINGNWHTLYDYLDSGKTVLINLASTYPDAEAGQSFLYFAEGHLNSFYSENGPDGNNTCMVLMLETDPYTDVNALFGIGNTFGDWDGYANFPIISNDSIGDYYPVGPVYPSSYMVCPNRETMHVGWATGDGLNYYVGLCGEAEYQNNVAIEEIINPGLGYCGSTLEPIVRIQNLGIEVLNTLTIEYSLDGNKMGSFNWEGNVSMYTTDEVVLPSIEIPSEGEHTISISLINPNDSIDEDDTDNTMLVNFMANFDGSPVTLDILTDDNPNELIWRIRQGSDILYSVQGYEKAGQIFENICLDIEQCYTLDVFDVNSNGMFEGNIGHFVLSWNGNTLIDLSGTDYSADFYQEFCLNQTSIKENNLLNTMKIYPNPAKDAISLDFKIENANVKIMDVSGKVVLSKEKVNRNEEINVSSLSHGMYFIVLENSSYYITDKLVIE
ncbi:MAG: hypothetical protein C0599_01230 [Salinivirgaceae bacterium]|nr:MAG: hypothetical protein C0599_01230 [Salinivirgaceae bacterium]